MGLGRAVGERHVDLGDLEVQGSFLGGLRLNGFDGTWPLVRMDLFASGLRLGPSKTPVRRIIPVWEARWSEVTDIRVSGRLPMLFSGVRFTAGREDWAIFWSPNRRPVIAALWSMGLQVTDEPIAHPFLDPGGRREPGRT
jgi:hypothetical protein